MQEIEKVDVHKVDEFIQLIVFEHPSTIMTALMYTMQQWMFEQRTINPDNFDKGKALVEFTKYMQWAVDREFFRRIHETKGKNNGNYYRRDYPGGHKLPESDWDKGMKISNEILGYLRNLPLESAYRFLSELIIAWFFSCPEVLLRQVPDFIGNYIDLPTSDFEFAYVLWVYYQLYLDDPAQVA